MKVLAITPWQGQGTPSGQACGIAQYAELLQFHTPPDIELVPCPEGLDPAWVLARRTNNPAGGPGWSYTKEYGDPPVIWLNYHRGLHSRWTPETLRGFTSYARVIITFHDTRGEAEPDALTRELHDLAEVFVVHEPCMWLEKAVVIRQGIPDWQSPHLYDQSLRSWCGPRPILGTCGFNFPWKNFDRLAEVTAEAGWAYLVLSNNATEADRTRWQASNPHTAVVSGFLHTGELVSRLAGCDATAFPYECANSGTSGAIRLGLAARKPVVSFPCRQMRDLYVSDPRQNIWWCEGWESLLNKLQSIPIQRVDPGIVYLAARDSWAKQGQRYADLFRGLLR